jgi:hypothetical protein
MSKLIRCRKTLRFLTKNGSWTSKLHDAARFLDHALAHAAVEQFQLCDVELYYLFGEHKTSSYDFTLPLR